MVARARLTVVGVRGECNGEREPGVGRLGVPRFSSRACGVECGGAALVPPPPPTRSPGGKSSTCSGEGSGVVTDGACAVDAAPELPLTAEPSVLDR